MSMEFHRTITITLIIICCYKILYAEVEEEYDEEEMMWSNNFDYEVEYVPHRVSIMRLKIFYLQSSKS